MRLGSAPFLATRIESDTAWVGLIYVPRELRRNGIGRRMFDRWARSVPEEVRQIRLLPVALDDESPVGFWQRLGFRFEETDPIIGGVAGACMSRRARERAGDDGGSPPGDSPSFRRSI